MGFRWVLSSSVFLLDVFFLDPWLFSGNVCFHFCKMSQCCCFKVIRFQLLFRYVIWFDALFVFGDWFVLI